MKALALIIVIAILFCRYNRHGKNFVFSLVDCFDTIKSKNCPNCDDSFGWKKSSYIREEGCYISIRICQECKDNPAGLDPEQIRVSLINDYDWCSDSVELVQAVTIIKNFKKNNSVPANG